MRVGLLKYLYNMKAKPIPTSPRERLPDERAADVDAFMRQPPPITQPKVVRFSAGFLIVVMVIGFIAGVVGCIGILFGREQWPWLARWVGQNEAQPTVIRTNTTSNNAPVYAEIAKKVSPSVVSIYVRRNPVEKNASILDQMYTPDDRRGTGVILTEDGLGATTRTSIPDLTKEIAVITESKQVYLTKKFYPDPASDLVFFRISGKGFPTQGFAQLDVLRPGQELLGLQRQSVTLEVEPNLGILLANLSYRVVDRSYLLRSSDKLAEVLQDSLSTLTPGMPVYALDGTLVGVHTGNDGDIIPATVISSALDRFNSTGVITRNVFGAHFIDLGIAKGLLLSPSDAGEEGALIAGDEERNIPALQPKSPAARAGLKAGDVITKVNDQQIHSNQSLNTVLQAAAPRSTVTITFLREGKEQTVPVTLDVTES